MEVINEKVREKQSLRMISRKKNIKRKRRMCSSIYWAWGLRKIFSRCFKGNRNRSVKKAEQKEKKLNDLFAMLSSAKYYLNSTAHEEGKNILESKGIDNARLLEFFPQDKVDAIAGKLKGAAKGRFQAMISSHE